VSKYGLIFPTDCAFVPKNSPIGTSASTVKSTSFLRMSLVTNVLPQVWGLGQNGTLRASAN